MATGQVSENDLFRPQDHSGDAHSKTHPVEHWSKVIWQSPLEDWMSMISIYSIVYQVLRVEFHESSFLRLQFFSRKAKKDFEGRWKLIKDRTIADWQGCLLSAQILNLLIALILTFIKKSDQHTSTRLRCKQVHRGESVSKQHATISCKEKVS